MTPEIELELMTADPIELEVASDQENLNLEAQAYVKGSGDGSLTEELKQALLQMAEHVAYIDEHGQDYYQDLYDALYPPRALTYISVVYDPGTAVIYESTSLDSLKQYLVVTAHYDDKTTEIIASEDYTLSGTLTVGTSVVTAEYRSKTKSFSVEVAEAPTLSSITAVFMQGAAVIYDTDSLDTLKQYLTVTANYSDGTSATVTDYMLSGTLTAGTSTITVSYSGKSTTINVTVTGIVCPLLNGTYYDSGNEYKVTISNGHHFRCEVIGNQSSTTHFIMVNAITGEISVSTSSSINNKNTVFSIQSGKTVTLKMTNIVIDKNGGTPSFQFLSLARLANGNTSFIATTEAEHPAGIDVTATKTTTAEANIGAIGIGVNGRNYSNGAYLEFDLEMYDDDNVYVGGR